MRADSEEEKVEKDCGKEIDEDKRVEVDENERKKEL